MHLCNNYELLVHRSHLTKLNFSNVTGVYDVQALKMSMYTVDCVVDSQEPILPPTSETEKLPVVVVLTENWRFFERVKTQQDAVREGGDQPGQEPAAGQVLAKLLLQAGRGSGQGPQQDQLDFGD